MLVFFPIHAEYGDISPVLLLNPLDHLDQRCFARAVWSQKSNEFPFVNGEAEVINRRNILKSFGDFRNFYDRCFRHLGFNIVMGNKDIKTSRLGWRRSIILVWIFVTVLFKNYLVPLTNGITFLPISSIDDINCECVSPALSI